MNLFIYFFNLIVSILKKKKKSSIWLSNFHEWIQTGSMTMQTDCVREKWYEWKMIEKLYQLSYDCKPRCLLIRLTFSSLFFRPSKLPKLGSHSIVYHTITLYHNFTYLNLHTWSLVINFLFGSHFNSKEFCFNRGNRTFYVLVSILALYQDAAQRLGKFVANVKPL